MNIKRISILSILLASSIVIGILESFIPAFFIPGVKLGLANIVILLGILNFKWYEALLISIFRVFIINLLLGSFLNVTFFMSLSGALFSFMIMELMFKMAFSKLPSIIFLSVLGSIAHGVGQIIMAMIIINSSMVIYYLPFILLFSIPTGLFVGIVVRTIQKTNILNNLLAKKY